MRFLQNANPPRKGSFSKGGNHYKADSYGGASSPSRYPEGGARYIKVI